MEIIQAASAEERLKILADGAKYDVSCSSSNGARRAEKGELGQCHIAGLCHSFTSDGRCVSLIKLLMTNKCEFDCLYCINRRSNDVPRASLTPREICELVSGFYRRNYIEGLFLSSAVETSPDATMQKLTETLVMLRTEYKFRAYVHVKAIPGASRHLIDLAAEYADRMSVNIELPSENSLTLLAPQKKKEMITAPMLRIAKIIYDGRDAPRANRPLPAGQTTQMIIGASPDSDGRIIRLSEALYRNFRLKRVYYSAYAPVNGDGKLPALPADPRRENRLYQADWLLRFYGFEAEELLPPERNLPLDIDPKSDWALRNIDKFPVEVNSASYETLLRTPGIGAQNAYRITQARKYSALGFGALKKMRVCLTKAAHFITANGEFLGVRSGDPNEIRAALTKGSLVAAKSDRQTYAQISIFDL
ncbi:MAG: putative DNA modification/repair radical SAM protein [Clostridiales bacterium]|jgi:putative DNA modification/repair radical SAM protein|nr:putative DNA modification/repair radical SAM protein [Clostridiales bacterium]